MSIDENDGVTIEHLEWFREVVNHAHDLLRLWKYPPDEPMRWALSRIENWLSDARTTKLFPAHEPSPTTGDDLWQSPGPTQIGVREVTGLRRWLEGFVLLWHQDFAGDEQPWECRQDLEQRLLHAFDSAKHRLEAVASVKAVRVQRAKAAMGLTQQPSEAGSDISAPEPAASESTDATVPAGMSWQDVAERLERLRTQGERWTSYADFAQRFRCSRSIVHKAVEKTESLHAWARYGAKKGAPPRATGLNDIHLQSISQSREPDPTEVLADSEAADQEEERVRVAWSRLMQACCREVRAWVNSLNKRERAWRGKALADYLAHTPKALDDLSTMRADDQLELVKTLTDDPDRHDQVLGRRA